MKANIVLTLLVGISVGMSGCSKDKQSEEPKVNYRVKFAGKYQCTAIKTYIEDSSNIETQEEFVVTVSLENEYDSTMRFICDEFNIGKLVTSDGVIAVVKDSSSYGKFVNVDSLYLYVYYFGHSGTTTWHVQGKK